jgi:hypothetical protein
VGRDFRRLLRLLRCDLLLDSGGHCLAMLVEVGTHPVDNSLRQNIKGGGGRGGGRGQKNEVWIADRKQLVCVSAAVLQRVCVLYAICVLYVCLPRSPLS